MRRKEVRIVKAEECNIVYSLLLFSTLPRGVVAKESVKLFEESECNASVTCFIDFNILSCHATPL